MLIGAFENTTGDPSSTRRSEALKVHLGQSPFLDIVPDNRIREALRPDGAPGRRADHRRPSCAEVCERLGVRAMLEGSIAPLGSTTCSR
jgi:hypothetical protein